MTNMMLVKNKQALERIIISQSVPSDRARSGSELTNRCGGGDGGGGEGL